MKRNLSFCFEYINNDCPHSVQVTPHPCTLTDHELVLTANTCIQALASKHGLEHAIDMINNAACGKLCDGTKFDTLWSNGPEQKDK